MVGPSALPNEVLTEIAQFVLPADFENFAQSSKHIHKVSQLYMAEHRRLIREYRHIEVPTDRLHYGDHHWLPLHLMSVMLKPVVDNPRIGH